MYIWKKIYRKVKEINSFLKSSFIFVSALCKNSSIPLDTNPGILLNIFYTYIYICVHVYEYVICLGNNEGDAAGGFDGKSRNYAY